MNDDELIKAISEEVMGKFQGYDFNPLSNANHWMMVVERMRELGWYCEIKLEVDYYVKFYKNGFGPKEALQLDIGHAICLAALKAVENG